jgi:RHS repeat-associated protein
MDGEDNRVRRFRWAGWAGLFGLSGAAGLGVAGKAVVVVSALALGASAIGGSTPAPEDTPWGGDIALPVPQRIESIEGGPVAVRLPAGLDTAAEKVLTDPAPPRWPAERTADVFVASGTIAVPELPVAVGGAEGVSSVRVQMHDRETAARAGVDGVVLSLTDPEAGGGSLDVELDYSSFAHAYGGGWGSRLVLVELPACALTTPDLPECRKATPVPGANRSADEVLQGRVTLAQSGAETTVPETAEPEPTTPATTPPSSSAPESTGPETTEPTSPPATTTAPPASEDNGQTVPQALAQGGDSSPTVLAAVAGAKGPEGDFTATDLAPAGSWSAGGSSGDFTYGYPMTAPPVPGGLAPGLNLSYSSGRLDGRTAETNNQTSWVGDGWDLAPGGFIERGFRTCAEDEGGNQGSDDRADLCWAQQRITISVGGVSGELIKNSSGEWVARADSGAKIELLTGATNGDDNGEHWKVTTTDGTRYFLGLNQLPGWSSGKPVTNSVFTAPVFGNHASEPCKAAAFADSWCQQAYRWSVDLVIDRHGNAMVYRYAQEKNRYTRADIEGAATEYVRGGHLTQIDYGLRDGALFDAPPAKVVFDVAERCVPSGAITCAPEQRTEANAAHWPDVPLDLICPTGDDCKAVFEDFEWNPGVHTPAFFTTKRLVKITTSVDVDGWKAVDSWSLTQSFPLTTDGSDPSLWLSSIQRTGHVGGAESTPVVTFHGSPKDNRVDGTTEIRPLPRYRLTGIGNGHGGYTGIRYEDPQCAPGQTMPAPQSNTLRCFPSYWKPYSGYEEPILDWFHKYVVAEVVEQDLTGGSPSVRTNYQYLGGGAWAWDDNELVDVDERTWSQWRGFGTVKTVIGDTGSGQVQSQRQYLRGMDGDRLPSGERDVSVQGTDDSVVDHEAAAGFLREERGYVDGQLTSLTINDPWVSAATATAGDKRAYKTGTAKVRDRVLKANGTWARTQSNTTFDAEGFPTEIEQMGSVSAWNEQTASGDEKCARTTYVSSASAHLIGLASTTTAHAGTCATQASAATVLSSSRKTYDGLAHGAAPTKGRLTKAEMLDSWEGSTKVWSETTASYDSYGRVVSADDVLGGTTTTAYQPATGLVTSVTVTDAKGHTATSDLDPRRGAPTSVVDAAGVRTTGQLDPLGRTVGVWAPGQPTSAAPVAKFSYAYRTDGPSWVKSEALTDSGSYRASYTLLDGLLRERQIQKPGPVSGRLVSDTVYDTRGLAVTVNNDYYNTQVPGTALLGVADNAVPSQAVTQYDTAGRPTASILRRYAAELWRTTTTYHGADKVSTVPPAGGTAVTVLTDGLGREVEKRDYQVRTDAGSETAAFQATRYTYTRADQLATVTDPAGAKWSFDYDLAGNRIESTDPDAGASTSVYNAAAQLLSSTDARGKTLAYAYDQIGRRTAVHEGTLLGPKLTEFTFDSLGNGRPVASIRHVGAAAYKSEITGYDSAGRPTGTKITIPSAEGQLAGEYTYGTTYTATGLVATETIPAAGGIAREVVHHSYDGAGLPEASWAFTPTTGATATYVSDTTHTEYGELLQTTRGAATSPRNVVTTNTYDDGTRRLIRTTVNRETATASQVADRRYSYNDAGHITRISDEPTGVTRDTQCFDHDWLGRLAEAWTPTTGDCAVAPTVANLGGAAPYWLEWQFDTAGNRTSETERSSSATKVRTHDYPDVDANGLGKPHTLTSVSESVSGGTPAVTAQFGYDAAGNTITRQVGSRNQALEWNSEGRVTKVTEGAQVTAYLYDASGTRLIARDSSGVTLYLPGQEVKLPTGLSTVSCTRYYTHGGSVAAQRSSAQGLSYLIGDHQGTGALALRTSDLQLSRRHQLPYGNPRGTSPAWPNLKGFVGGDNDPTGLTHVGAREYDPATGRFISVDPLIDFADNRQMHGYAYANHNPVSQSDPTGLLPPMMDGCGVKNSDCLRKVGGPQKPPGKPSGGGGSGGSSGSGGGGGAWHQPYSTNIGSQTVWSPTYEKYDDAWQKATAIWFEKYDDTHLRGLECATPDTNLGDGSGLCQTGLVLHANHFAEVMCAQEGITCAHNLSPMAATMRTVDPSMLVGGMVAARLGLDGPLPSTRPGLDRSLVKAACNSFPPGTRVLLADGSFKPIEDVRVGDSVLAADPRTGAAGAREVIAEITSEGVKRFVRLMVDSDGDGTVDATLTSTEEHRVWLPVENRWDEARDLEAGDHLLDSSGASVRVAAVATGLETWAKVHNLTVDDLHTYHVVVGATAVLVHNETSCWKPQGRIDHIPTGWGDGRPNKKGIGTRWADPKNEGNGVRIDQGNPNNPQVAQQVDHVVVRHNGKVIGRDGKPVHGSIKDDPMNAHIPFAEWSTWRKWYAP